MPPSRPRPNVDDSRSETSNTNAAKDRHGVINSHLAGATKGKRMAHSSTALSHSKATSAPNGAAAAAADAGSVAADSDVPRITWSSLSLPVLHSYRHDYKLPTPAAYTNPHAQHILSYGIGTRSPSSIATKRATRAARKTNGVTTNGISKDKDKDKNYGRIPKEQLANNVRKHFNNLAVSEGEVIAKFRYVVRMGGLPDTVYTPRGGTGLGGVPAGGGEREFRSRFHP